MWRGWSGSFVKHRFAGFVTFRASIATTFSVPGICTASGSSSTEHSFLRDSSWTGTSTARIPFSGRRVFEIRAQRLSSSILNSSVPPIPPQSERIRIVHVMSLAGSRESASTHFSKDMLSAPAPVSADGERCSTRLPRSRARVMPGVHQPRMVA